MKEQTTKKKNEFVLYRFLIAVLRRAYRKTPMYSAALRAAKEEYFIPNKSGGMTRRVHFKCAECGRFFSNKPGARDIAVDHKLPVISPETGFVDYNTLIARLFCSTEDLQVLCNYAGIRDGRRSCHKLKTKREQEILRETKNKLKSEGKNITTKER